MCAARVRLRFTCGVLQRDHWHRGEAIGEAIGEASAVILWTGETPQAASERVQLLRARRFGELHERMEKG